MREALRRHAGWVAPRTEPGGATPGRPGSRPTLRRPALPVSGAHSSPSNLCTPTHTPIDVCRQPSRGPREAIRRITGERGSLEPWSPKPSLCRYPSHGLDRGPPRRPQHATDRGTSAGASGQVPAKRWMPASAPRTFDGDPITIPLRFGGGTRLPPCGPRRARPIVTPPGSQPWARGRPGWLPPRRATAVARQSEVTRGAQ